MNANRQPVRVAMAVRSGTPDDRRSRHAGGRPPQRPAGLCAGKVRTGNGQRGTQHRGIGQAARQGADEEHGEGRSQTER